MVDDKLDDELWGSRGLACFVHRMEHNWYMKNIYLLNGWVNELINKEMDFKKDQHFNYAKIKSIGPRVWEIIVGQVEISIWL